MWRKRNSSTDPPPRADLNGAEAFLVSTEKIFYLAYLYLDDKQSCQGAGYTIFADGETWYFSMDGAEDPDVKEKCQNVGKRIARVYNGKLEKGSLDSYGRFWAEHVEQPNSE
ncbi:MAG: hypothetical protein R6X08_09705 [Desulfosalsimonadaceae bacterium]